MPLDPRTSAAAAAIAHICRWLLLLVLGGNLLLRQSFAHRNLGEATGIAALNRAYVTEVVMLILAPAVAWLAWLRWRDWNERRAALITKPPVERSRWLPAAFAAAFLAWGAIHVLAGFFTGGDAYLVFRQGAAAAYGAFFLYGLVLFSTEKKYVSHAVLFAAAVAAVCAILDAVASGMVEPNNAEQAARHPWLAFLNTKPYGQETLPILLLGLSVLMVDSNWLWRGAALVLLAFAGWRQGIRFQSTVPISLAGALGAYLLFGAVLALRGQVHTLRRAATIIATLALLLVGFRTLRTSTPTDSAEVRAWSLDQYGKLFEVYERTTTPAVPDFFSTRDAVVVTDPEIYKLEAVFMAASDDSVRNNMWRFLVWRRMLLDWKDGRTFIGAGIGRPWFYGALYHTHFHYGEPREGLDPHNSFIHLLYRYGAVGMGFLLALAGAVLYLSARALRREGRVGDPLLEAILLYFFYTVFFACFTVALEGPSYSLPFWISLSLASCRALQLLRSSDDALEHAPLIAT